MPSAWVLLAEGFEEIEAVTIIDVLRRAQVEVVTVGQVAGSVCGSHGVRIVADTTMAEVGDSLPDVLILPGGLPGSTNLRDDARVVETVRRHAEQGRIVAAICAAPIVLEAAGVLTGRRATGYPGHDLPSAVYVEDRVVEDSNIITSRGPGTALEFSMKLVQRLIGGDAVAELRRRMLVA
jgi:4-methyl-5(b-hydroxyethyl)-thiazole monophosphate biosynthesis